jgi:hypothetical protein
MPPDLSRIAALPGFGNGFASRPHLESSAAQKPAYAFAGMLVAATPYRLHLEPLPVPAAVAVALDEMDRLLQPVRPLPLLSH